MPFGESGSVEERVALLREFESGAFSVVELCARYGISRDTFYVWKRRRAQPSPPGGGQKPIIPCAVQREALRRRHGIMRLASRPKASPGNCRRR